MEAASAVSFGGWETIMGFPSPLPDQRVFPLRFVLCEIKPFAASRIVDVER
jgi:hypothetical protein